MRGIITVITGGRGSGKTAYCLQTRRSALEANIRTAGVISPAVYENGRKTAFYTMDAETGEQRLCGSRSENGTIGCWQMDPEILDWGNELIRRSGHCGLLFIDELGPLEFEKNEGYTAAFTALEHGDFDEALVVIRPECLDAFRERFPVFRLKEMREGKCITGQTI